MKILIETAGKTFAIDVEKPISIAIPIDFYGEQVNAYGVEKAASSACVAGKIVGDTRRGGSCNFEQIKMIPHCNGTHTECVGHITNERISVNDCLKDAFSQAFLISVEPENSGETNETYSIRLERNDQLITRRKIEEAITNYQSLITNPESRTTNYESLIVRTLPNDKSKLSKTYLAEIPPFFSTEAMQFIREIGIKHLLCDLPSVDRIFDEGKLSNHRIFWNVKQGAFEVCEKTLIQNTITELIYVPEKVADGSYLLNLQISPFVSDAAPSRPVLFEIFD